MARFVEDNPNQISRKQQDAESKYFEGLKKQADKTKLSDPIDYKTAPFLVLEARYKLGDEEAKQEMFRRNPALRF